jgi:hypothetical protein
MSHQYIAAKGDTVNTIEPPWVKFPGFPPGDGFWRHSGEIWFKEVWEPYWEALSSEGRERYLEQWAVPKVWRDFYFDRKFQQWLDSVDDDK